MNNYIIYHLHTMLSNGVTNVDSITTYQQYIDRAKEYGMTAIGFSEHGSVFSWLKKKEAVEKAGLKYIHGCEVYVTETIEEKVRDNYHCVLIAKNYDGVLELNKLVSHAFNRAEVKTFGDENMYYYAPRILFSELIATSDNIIISTACLASILNNAPDAMRERFICFLAANKHRCFLEIQHHNVEEQKEYNKYLYALSQTIGVPLIAGTDTHALNKTHMEGRAILQKSKKVHFENEDKWNLIMMNRKELEDAYDLQNALPKEVYMAAIDKTNDLADMIETFTIDRSYKYPHLWEDSMATFREKIENGIKWRGVDKYPNYQEYLDRIKYETEAYVHNDAIDFMLLMEDIISWCRSQDIMVGYGRGSVNGSVIAWLLGITEMDSIKFHLNFERFMNVERVSLSDIDTDFPPSRIEDVKQYIFSKHGLHCSDIITFNTISDKGAIKDVARALEIPLDEAQQIANSVDNEEKYAESRKKYPELFKWVDLVKGTVVSIGSHPCGTIVSPETLEDHIGLCTTSTSNYPISQLYMKEVDSLNYVKLDLLKLDTIELISKTCELAGIDKITPDNIDVNDIKVWNAIRDDTTQIFQWEGSTGDRYIKKLLSDDNIKKLQAVNENIDRMTLLSIGNSAIRPAGASYREDLANGVVRTTGSKPIDDFLSNTFGYLVFQCQIIDFLHLYCGFTMGEADVVRRCVAEDTKITTGYGYQKEIRHLKPGDTVISYNDYGYPEVDIVNNVFDNGIQECFQIDTKNGNVIECTGSHKILTQDGFKEASRLSTDDWVMVPSRIVYKNDGLRPNQRLSSDTLFLIGLLLGDGYIHVDNPSYVNHEMMLIEKYKQCINQLSRSKRPCEFLVYDTDGVTVDKIYTIKIASKQYRNALNSLLDKYDMKYPACNKRINEEIMSYPADIKLSNLLAGLFNSDGGYNLNSASIEYSSISKLLVEQIKCLLLKYGIYSYITKSIVKDYDYYSYVLHISHIDSIEMFEQNILPYMIGKKYKCFQRVIELAKQIKYYNYILPPKCKNEILTASEISKKSIRSITIDARYDLELKANYPCITDTKARYFTSKLYCPETYKMLVADYMPLQITSITKVGQKHVYDIEVNKNHNYIANGIIVHNCFAKKLGTEQCIPVIKDGGYITENSKHHIDGYIKTMKEKYNIPEEKSEEDIVAFIKVIEDASSYLFSLNHSQPYSLEGYVSGWLRTYYPLEFLTVAMNINRDKEEKTLALTEYAKKIGIKFHAPQFRYSRGDYFCDKETNTIYKGTESIKFLNDSVSNELVELGKKHYGDYVDLLYDLKEKSSINSRQLDILIKLDFFQEFGDPNTLLWITDLFEKLYDKRSIKKDSPFVSIIGEELLRKFSDSETPTHTDEINVEAFLISRGITDDIDNELCDCIKYKYIAISQADIDNYEEYLTTHNEVDIVPNIDTNKKVKIPNGYSYAKIFKKYEITDEERQRFATKTVYGKFDYINTRQLLKYLLKNSKYPPVTIQQRIRWQSEHLGYIDYTDSAIDKRYFVVTQLDTTYSPKFNAYCINNGRSVEMRVRKKRNPKNKNDKCKTSFSDEPFADGDILYLKAWGQEPKMKKVGDDWVKDPSVMINWLYDYEVKNL